jgi:hypothetical protein
MSGCLPSLQNYASICTLACIIFRKFESVVEDDFLLLSKAQVLVCIYLVSKALCRLNRGDVWIDENSVNAFLLQRFDAL